MTTHETELKALMLASLDGDAASHRALLERLSRRLRAYYKGKLAGIGRDATEAEDLVQEAAPQSTRRERLERVIRSNPT
jgi:RNA polymerase sigma-70 factor (ECF subfamily)